MALSNQRIIMVLASAIVYFLILASLPLRIKMIMKKAGKNLVAVQGKNILMQILIIIVSGLLIGMLYIRELGFFADIVICLVGILGCAMGAEEAALNNKCGLYENGIIGNGRFLPLSEIFALPTLTYSKEEQAALDQKVLVVTTDKNGTVNFLYATPEEKDLMEKGLISLNPGLAR